MSKKYAQVSSGRGGDALPANARVASATCSFRVLRFDHAGGADGRVTPSPRASSQASVPAHAGRVNEHAPGPAEDVELAHRPRRAAIRSRCSASGMVRA